MTIKRTKYSIFLILGLIIAFIEPLSAHFFKDYNFSTLELPKQNLFNKYSQFTYSDTIIGIKEHNIQKKKIVAPFYNFGVSTIFSASERSGKIDARWLRVDAGAGIRLFSFLDNEIGMGMRYFYDTNSFLFPLYGGGGFSVPIKNNRIFLKTYLGRSFTSSQFHFDNGFYFASQIGYEFTFFKIVNSYLSIGLESFQTDKSFLGIFFPMTTGYFFSLGLSFK